MRTTVVALLGLLSISALALACSGAIEPITGSDDAGAGGGADAAKPDASLGTDGGLVVADAAPDDAHVKKGDAATSDAGTCADNAPCDVEGAFCKPSPCNDPCQFCNVFSCVNGTWQGLEAFPLPQNECASTFPCGGATCTHGNYCLEQNAGVAFPDGGIVPPTYTCVPMDPTCLGGCGCAMNAAKKTSSCTPSNCTAPDGGPIVHCYGI